MENWTSHKVALSAIRGIVKAEHVVQTQKECPQQQLAAQTGVQELHEKFHCHVESNVMVWTWAQAEPSAFAN